MIMNISRQAPIAVLVFLCGCGSVASNSEPAHQPPASETNGTATEHQASAEGDINDADDPRWTSMTALPVDALPRLSAGDTALARQLDVIMALHKKRFAEPARRDLATMNGWAREVFKPWVDERGNATRLVADELIEASEAG